MTQYNNGREKTAYLLIVLTGTYPYTRQLLHGLARKKFRHSFIRQGVRSPDRSCNTCQPQKHGEADCRRYHQVRDENVHEKTSVMSCVNTSAGGFRKQEKTENFFKKYAGSIIITESYTKRCILAQVAC